MVLYESAKTTEAKKRGRGRRLISPFRPGVQAARCSPWILGLDDALGRAARGGILAAVREREVRARAHLDEARGGALEFLRFETVAGAIERRRRTFGGRKEFHRVIVQRVDERDEALSFVALRVIHYRDT